MKKVILFLSMFGIVSGIALAQTGSTKKPMPKSQAATATTHNVNAEFVSMDATTKKLTIKDDKGKQQILPLESAAVTEAKAFKSGDKVTLTCRDDSKGQHEAVTHVKAHKV